jgi:hypothetical protein
MPITPEQHARIQAFVHLLGLDHPHIKRWAVSLWTVNDERGNCVRDVARVYGDDDLVSPLATFDMQMRFEEPGFAEVFQQLRTSLDWLSEHRRELPSQPRADVFAKVASADLIDELRRRGYRVSATPEE